MANTKTNRGSAVIIILLVVAGLTLWCSSLWRSVTLAHDLAIKKQEFEQQYQCTQGIMRYAIACATLNYELLTDSLAAQQNLLIDCGAWQYPPTPLHSWYTAIRYYKKHNSADIIAQALLRDNQQVLCTVQCTLHAIELQENSTDEKQRTITASQWQLV